MSMISIIFETTGNMIKEQIKTKNKKTLEKFLSSGPESLEYITLKSELQLHLTDPGIFEKSDRASEELRSEARTIMDAFEAVTNGMYNPEVLTALKGISEESLFFYWKELIFSIHAFYDKDYYEMEARLNNIDSESSLIIFKPLLLQLTGKIQTQKLPNKQKIFIDNIIKDRSFIRSVITEIIESLQYDMEDLFLETTNLMLQDLNRNYKEPAYKFAIWSIEAASRYKYSPTELIATCKKLFGNTLAFRLTAIAMEKEEPDISLLFWIQSLLSRLKSKDLTLEETGAYFTIFSRLSEKIKTSQDKFFLESLSGLINNMKYELDNKFNITTSNKELYNNPFEILISLSSVYSTLAENKIRFETLNTVSKSSVPTITTIVNKPQNKNRKPVQLSLFD